MTGEQAAEMLVAYKENYQLQGSYGFNGKKPFKYGQGLTYHFNRLTGSSVALDE